jgi:hypothetical protein
MVEVSVTASVKVLGGPTLPVSASLDPDSYTVAALTLGPAGAAEEEQTVALLPEGGTVVLLAVNARTAGGTAATVTLTAKNGSAEAELGVIGTLLIANAGVLAALVTDGPRSVTVKNTESDSVTVDIITGLDPI